MGIHLRFAGQALARVLLPALAPVLCPNDRNGDVEIELWDERTTGVRIPDPVWRLRDVIARGDVRSLAGARVRAQVDSGNEILTLWDREARRGVVWAADAEALPYWVPAAPLRSILHWCLADRHRHLLHAGAIGDEQAGALLVGPGGSGKSTTALACVAHGLGYVGDDYVVAEIGPSPRAISVYGTAKLNPSSAKLLPDLPAPLMPDSPKLVVDLAGAQPHLMRRAAAVSVILMPHVAPGPVALRPASGAEALHALAPSTILQHAEESATGMAVMAELVRGVPSYHLDLGSDIAAVGAAVRELLEAS